jgi:hypothetical protein
VVEEQVLQINQQLQMVVLVVVEEMVQLDLLKVQAIHLL